jgi:hypothetical protein
MSIKYHLKKEKMKLSSTPAFKGQVATVFFLLLLTVVQIIVVAAYYGDGGNTGSIISLVTGSFIFSLLMIDAVSIVNFIKNESVHQRD